MEKGNNNTSQINLELALIPLGIALNLSIGTIVSTLKLPIYLDAVGTIIITLLIGLRGGIITGVLSFLFGGLLTNPILPYFCGTQAAIAVYVYFLARIGAFRSTIKTIFTGVGLGIVAAVVSAPIIVYLFGGITGSGRSLIVSFLLASGENIMKSVIYSGIAAEPIDKTIQCLLALWLLKSLPNNLMEKYKNDILIKNNIVN